MRKIRVPFLLFILQCLYLGTAFSEDAHELPLKSRKQEIFEQYLGEDRFQLAEKQMQLDYRQELNKKKQGEIAACMFVAVGGIVDVSLAHAWGSAIRKKLKANSCASRLGGQRFVKTMLLMAGYPVTVACLLTSGALAMNIDENVPQFRAALDALKASPEFFNKVNANQSYSVIWDDVQNKYTVRLSEIADFNAFIQNEDKSRGDWIIAERKKIEAEELRLKKLDQDVSPRKIEIKPEAPKKAVDLDFSLPQ